MGFVKYFMEKMQKQLMTITSQGYGRFLMYQRITKGDLDFINIGENIRNMGAFTRLRDTNSVFDHCKEIGDVGIPAFVFEDGRVSIDPADAGLIEYGTANACSIEDHKSGRKGC
ncbi:glutaredoxin-related protein [Pseudobutyrivibrio xylanivorans]|nr:glutaredoxin-related protein [Pseudobutyrivibrio xylanivorans]